MSLSVTGKEAASHPSELRTQKQQQAATPHAVLPECRAELVASSQPTGSAAANHDAARRRAFSAFQVQRVVRTPHHSGTGKRDRQPAGSPGSPRGRVCWRIHCGGWEDGWMDGWMDGWVASKQTARSNSTQGLRFRGPAATARSKQRQQLHLPVFFCQMPNGQCHATVMDSQSDFDYKIGNRDVLVLWTCICYRMKFFTTSVPNSWTWICYIG